MSEDLQYSPGLDRPYSATLRQHVQRLAPGESIFWRDGGWAATGPGVEFVKDHLGFIRPRRRRRDGAAAAT